MVKTKTVRQLIKGGYKQAAFEHYENADKFAKAWENKGYSTNYIRSNGPAADTGNYVKTHYIVVMDKNKSKKGKTSNPVNKIVKRII